MFSRLGYCNALYSGINQASLSKLQVVQNAAERLLTRTKYVPTINKWLIKCIWQSKRPRLKYERLLCSKDREAWIYLIWKNTTCQHNLGQWLLGCLNNGTIWVGMEQSDLPDRPLDSIPFLSQDIWSKKRRWTISGLKKHLKNMVSGEKQISTS